MINDAYLESKILSTDPVGLIRLLYDDALRALRGARVHLAKGEIGERSRAISRVMAILTELSSSLDHAAGGEISFNLARLYDYMQQRLLDANLKQADQPLAEVQDLMKTLAEAWHGVADAREVASPQSPAAVPVWTTNRFQANEAHELHAWSA